MKYSLSYTAASLRIHDTLLVAKAMHSGNFDAIDEKIGNGKRSTGKRIRQEMTKRLHNLTSQQFSYLLQANPDDAQNLAFVAVCKTYRFIYEFIVEVLCEKMLHLDFKITDGEYLSFYNRKAELHPQLEELSQTSSSKIRQVLFKILEEVGLIDSVRNKVLQPKFVSPEVGKLLREDDPQLLRIFLSPITV
ncbi:MAG: DUF1819 family protein [Bacteroidales bacterium]|nr:DUF1819 family protein [Bacteroidales bacterium]